MTHEDEWKAYGQDLLDAGRPGWKGRQWLLTDALEELRQEIRDYEPEDEADYEGRFPTYHDELLALAWTLAKRVREVLDEGDATQALLNKVERRAEAMLVALDELGARLDMRVWADERKAEELRRWLGLGDDEQ